MPNAGDILSEAAVVEAEKVPCKHTHTAWNLNRPLHRQLNFEGGWPWDHVGVISLPARQYKQCGLHAEKKKDAARARDEDKHPVRAHPAASTSGCQGAGRQPSSRSAAVAASDAASDPASGAQPAARKGLRPAEGRP